MVNIFNIFGVAFLYAFIVPNSVLIDSLKNSMDMQSSDGRALLLKYATSYVRKMKDHAIMNGLLQLQLYVILLLRNVFINLQ